RWWRQRLWAPRDGPWSAGTRAGCRWCWRCWKHIAACGSAATTAISTSPAACASRSRPAISPPPPRRSPRWATPPWPADAVYFGEVSLSGAIRPVAQAAARLKEAAKLGFAGAFVPEAAKGDAGLRAQEIGTLATLVADIAARGRQAKKASAA